MNTYLINIFQGSLHFHFDAFHDQRGRQGRKSLPKWLLSVKNLHISQHLTGQKNESSSFCRLSAGCRYAGNISLFPLPLRGVVANIERRAEVGSNKMAPTLSITSRFLISWRVHFGDGVSAYPVNVGNAAEVPPSLLRPAPARRRRCHVTRQVTPLRHTIAILHNLWRWLPSTWTKCARKNAELCCLKALPSFQESSQPFLKYTSIGSIVTAVYIQFLLVGNTS